MHTSRYLPINVFTLHFTIKHNRVICIKLHFELYVRIYIETYRSKTRYYELLTINYSTTGIRVCNPRYNGYFHIFILECVFLETVQSRLKINVKNRNFISLRLKQLKKPILISTTYTQTRFEIKISPEKK